MIGFVKLIKYNKIENLILYHIKKSIFYLWIFFYSYEFIATCAVDHNVKCVSYSESQSNKYENQWLDRI